MYNYLSSLIAALARRERARPEKPFTTRDPPSTE